MISSNGTSHFLVGTDRAAFDAICLKQRGNAVWSRFVESRKSPAGKIPSPGENIRAKLARERGGTPLPHASHSALAAFR